MQQFKIYSLKNYKEDREFPCLASTIIKHLILVRYMLYNQWACVSLCIIC